MVECIGCLPYVVLVGLEEKIHHWHVWFVGWLAVGVVVDLPQIRDGIFFSNEYNFVLEVHSALMLIKDDCTPCGMAMRDALASPSTICALHATAGRYGRSNSPSCVDSNCLPFGMVVWRRVCVWHLFFNGISTSMKCPVAPKSRMPHFVWGLSW